MNTTSIFNYRLLKFAKHLFTIPVHPRQGELTVVSIYALMRDRFRITYEVNIPAWITQELCIVFPEHWHFNEERNEYTLIGIPDEATAEAGIGAFFDVSKSEFLHCFSIPDKTKERVPIDIYGGQELNEDCSPCEIARNLTDLATYRFTEIRFK